MRFNAQVTTVTSENSMSVFQQGLSGLNASQRNLEVISNNISNANAAGFKASFAQFADIYNGGSAGVTVGSGTQVADISRQFTQGNVLSTNNPLDFAINGEGFFKVQSEKGSVIYTRNGQFGLDKDGFVINSQNERLQALGIDPATGDESEKATPLQIIKSAIPPKATTTFDAELNLDAREVEPTAAFSISDSKTYNASLTQTVYNNLGEPSTAQVYFRRIADSTVGTETFDTWEVYASVDGELQNGGAALGAIRFDSNGKQVSETPMSFSLGEGFSEPVTLNVNKTTQYSSNFSIFNLGQNGYDSAAFKNFTVDGNGKITLNYANGQNQDLARVPLFKFNNPDGLQPIGASGFLATLEAGSEIISGSGDAAFGVIRAGAIEEANVDLTTELVAMITAQRIYQANSQSIKTQDALLQTVTNLK
jgi:flagellar hook protein FlgE